MFITGEDIQHLAHVVRSLEASIIKLTGTLEMTSQAMTDLNNVVVALTDAINSEIAALQAAMTNSTGTPEDTAGIETVVGNIQNLVNQLKASVTPPAPVTPPSA
jgi:hypothetical protein